MAIELDSTQQAYDARIRVVGVGGGGGNAVRTMITRGLEGVEFIAANTDHQSLMSNPAGVKIHLGKSITRGLGAGSNPEQGRKAVEESLDDVRDALVGSDMIFVTAGMGGGTGTGAAPVIARLGREMGALVVGIVTKPFAYEARKRNLVADAGVKELRENVDALIVIPNQRVLSIVDQNVTIQEAFNIIDTVLYNATKGIADIISGIGLVNVDFADVRTVMANMGDALMGIGTSSGEHRALEAAMNALNSPILEGMSIYGSKGLLVNITGGERMTMYEVAEAVGAIEKAAGEEVNLIHGIVIDPSMEDEMSVTVVATGFHREERSKPVVTILPRVEADGNVAAPAAASASEAVPAPVREMAPAAVHQVPVAPVHSIPKVYNHEQVDEYEVPAYVRKQREQQQQRGDEPTAAPGNNMSSYPVPPRKVQQAGGSNTPAFLRKIMD